MSSVKNKYALQNRETYSRINFLYQAAVLMSGKNNVLGSQYGRLCKNIAQKGVLHLGPQIKRNLCKKCSLAIKPATTADLDVVVPPENIEKKETHNRKRKCGKAKSNNLDEKTRITVKCRQCGYDRKFQSNSNYSFWLDNPDSSSPSNVNSDRNVLQTNENNDGLQQKSADT